MSATIRGRRARAVDLLVTLGGLVGLVLLLVFYDQAFPVAALDLGLSRAAVAQDAQAYVAERMGYDLRGYQMGLAFTERSWASIYLQRTLGVPETVRLIRERVLPIWQWRVRWFRPLQREEFLVTLSPQGRVEGFSHVVPEDAPGANLSQEQARTIAIDFLTQDRGWTMASWVEVVASSTERPGGRTDHFFEWERRDWSIGDSQLRVSVSVQGDVVGYYDYWLKIPEAFQRDFAQRRNLPDFVNDLSLSASFVVLGVLVVLMLWRESPRWARPTRSAIIPAGIVGTVVLAASLNYLPQAKAWYNTTENYGLFWLGQASGALVSGVSSAVFVAVLWYVARGMARYVWPRRDRVLARRQPLWDALARSTWRGLMLGLILGGYVVLFYLAATELFGGWTPLYLEYAAAYATPLPFLAPLSQGLFPGAWEELMFRMALISGVLWFTRTFTRLPGWVRRAIALVVPAALWAFAHLGYVRDPFYLRGFELTLAGVALYGVLFMKFDLVTTIAAHVAYNAGIGAIPLLRSNQPYFVISGLIVLATLVAPVVPGAARAIRRRLRGEAVDAPAIWIRPAQRDDVGALDALMPQVAWETLLGNRCAVVLCLQADEEIVGAAAGQLDDGVKATVRAVTVASAWRRQYWGSELVEELRVRLAALGAESIDVQTPTDDKVAMRFWNSQGWRHTAVVFRWPARVRHFQNWRELASRLLGRRLL